MHEKAFKEMILCEQGYFLCLVKCSGGLNNYLVGQFLPINNSSVLKGLKLFLHILNLVGKESHLV